MDKDGIRSSSDITTVSDSKQNFFMDNAQGRQRVSLHFSTSQFGFREGLLTINAEVIFTFL